MNLKKNRFKVTGDTTILYCDYKGEEIEVLIDTEDLEMLQTGFGKWCVNPPRGKKVNMYIQATILGEGGKKASLHRTIMGNPEGVVDHKDRNTLNCRKSNLHATTQMVNCRNRKSSTDTLSGQKGVNWNTRDNRWRVRIDVDGKRINVGSFIDLEDAIEARKQAEDKYWGYRT